MRSPSPRMSFCQSFQRRLLQSALCSALTTLTLFTRPEVHLQTEGRNQTDLRRVPSDLLTQSEWVGAFTSQHCAAALVQAAHEMPVCGWHGPGAGALGMCCPQEFEGKTIPTHLLSWFGIFLLFIICLSLKISLSSLLLRVWLSTSTTDGEGHT